jgi:hypothetical protein
VVEPIKTHVHSLGPFEIFHQRLIGRTVAQHGGDSTNIGIVFVGGAPANRIPLLVQNIPDLAAPEARSLFVYGHGPDPQLILQTYIARPELRLGNRSSLF